MRHDINYGAFDPFFKICNDHFYAAILYIGNVLDINLLH